MPNTLVMNPNTGSPSFGLVPGMNSRGTVIVSGEIRLLRGKHLGPNRGFGACHIWAEHTKEMEKLGFLLESDAPKYVAQIIRTGTPLFYSGDSFTKIRLMAVRAVAGTATLDVTEQRELTFRSGDGILRNQKPRHLCGNRGLKTGVIAVATSPQLKDWHFPTRIEREECRRSVLLLGRVHAARG